MKKRLLSFRLALALTASAAAALPDNAFSAQTAFALQEDRQQNGYEYQKLKDGTAELTKYSGEDDEVEIPSEIDGLKVTALGEGLLRTVSSQAFGYRPA